MATENPVPAPVLRCAERAIQGVLDRYRPNVVAWDTETTGLRGAVIQAAAVELTAKGDLVNTMNGIIAPPPNVPLERGAVAVHGIDRKRIKHEAVEAVPFLRGLVEYLQESSKSGKRVVAHNSSFDVGRLNDTLVWHSMPQRLDGDDCFCTMRAAKRHCGLQTRTGQPKNPKNEELFRILTGKEASEEFGELHDATADALVTATSFNEGRRRRWW